MCSTRESMPLWSNQQYIVWRHMYPDWTRWGFWIVQQQLLAHADRCLETIKCMDLDAEATIALGSLGILYADQGRLQGAEAMYQRALDGYEKAWGPDHTSTLTTKSNCLYLIVAEPCSLLAMLAQMVQCCLHQLDIPFLVLARMGSGRLRAEHFCRPLLRMFAQTLSQGSSIP
jgi:tetratricopeptide (TPR) repeat protein